MEHSTKKFPLLLLLAFLFVLGVGLGFGYYVSQENVLKDRVKTVETELAQIENEIAKLRESDTVSAQTAVSALQSISVDAVDWSKVLTSIITVAPKDPVAVRALVEFTSYSGAEGGRLTLNTRTYPSRDVRSLLNAVAKTIDSFNENPDFSDAFVPSISKSISENEEAVLSFILNVTYKPSYAEASNDSSATVPRR